MQFSPRSALNVARTVHLVVALVQGTMVNAPDYVSDILRPFMMYRGSAEVRVRHSAVCQPAGRARSRGRGSASAILRDN